MVTADLWGRGVHGPVAKHAVVPATVMTEGWQFDDEDEVLDHHDWTALILANRKERRFVDRDLFEERGYADAGVSGLEALLVGEMSAIDRGAAQVALERSQTGASVVDICRARGIGFPRY